MKDDRTNLAFLLPVLDVFDLAASTDVHVLARSDEHIISGHNVRDWWLARIISSYPHSDRYVVARSTVGDRQKAMQTEQQLCPAVVVGCGVFQLRQYAI